MKTLNDLLVLGAFISGILSSLQASGEKMPMATQDLVITKIERVLNTLDPKDPAWLGSQQRLADLLSERARNRFMVEVETNCNGCKGSKDDRKKAIHIYEILLTQVKVNEHGPILYQLAHLYQMADQNDKAIALLENILKDAPKKQILPEIVSRSHVGLGDLLSQKSQFVEAGQHYRAALKDKKLENRSLCIYNLAWAEFNADHLNSAIELLEKLLANPTKITRETEDGSQYDGAFHTDILRDLATFYSKKDITFVQINNFEKLAPENKRKDLLLYFSKEADRLGQKKAAHEILARYRAIQGLSSEERIESSLQSAQINYDSGHTKIAIAEFSTAALAIQKEGCSDDSDKCAQLQKNMKRFVTELHRLKKLNPDQELLSAYVSYTNTYPLDAEMGQRGAQVALEVNNYPVAISLYRRISENKKFSDKERETALVSEVSAAEKSKDLNLQKEAYLHYLKYNSNPQKAFEVKYQLAYLSLQQKDYHRAAEDFEDLAKDKSGDAKLRKKAADLSLDSLVQISKSSQTVDSSLKTETDLEDLAWEYAQQFPEHQTEFTNISRKALINKAARVANSPRAEKSDIKSALKNMDSEKIINASTDEKLLFYYNRKVLAKKLDAEDIYLDALGHILGIAGLDKKYRESNLAELTGYYEKKLDFKKAYKTALQLENKSVPESEKQFRLGTLADLGGLDASEHYRKSLRTGLMRERALMVRSRLVLLSSRPVAELKTQALELKKRPALLNETTLLVFAKTQDRVGLRSILKLKELKNRSAALFIQKQPLYQEIQQAQLRLADHNLNLGSDQALQKTISQRVQLLKKADELLSTSIDIKDVTAQLMALNLIDAENERLVKNLAGLPMPATLNAQEKKQYIAFLKDRSKPFLYKARVAQLRQKEIWKGSGPIQALIRDYKMARPEIRALLGKELQLLVALPGDSELKKSVGRALNDSFVSAGELVSARESVSENPLSIKEIEKLKILETKIGHPLMPAYLEARLNRIQRGNSL